jgi:hypothetical protein
MDKILLALAEFRTEMKNFFSSASTISADLVKDLKAQLATATADVTARDATIKELQAAAGTATTTLAAKDTEITTLKASVDTEKKLANEVLAAQGLPAGGAPAAEAAGPAGAPAKSLVEQMEAITDPVEKSQFRSKNFNALLKQGQALLRAQK